MARGGRKRRSGPREPNGRVKRAFAYDRGSEGVIRRQLMYGGNAPEQTFDAIGRAFCAGLVSEAQRDAARKISAQYRAVYGLTMYRRDTLAQYLPQESGGNPDPAFQKIREDALNDIRDAIRGVSRDTLAAFDEVVIDTHTDAGPEWLDRIIFRKRVGKGPNEADGYKLMLLRRALKVVA